jgi:hypothetical protein
MRQIVICCLVLLAAARPSIAATFAVNDSGDTSDASAGPPCDVDLVNSGDQCSLRAAIEAANGLVGQDSIVFALAGPAPHVITLSSPLPSVTSPVTIDGTTQPGYSLPPSGSGMPVVVVNCGVYTDGLSFAPGSDGSAASGLEVTSLASCAAAVRIMGASNVHVKSSYLHDSDWGVYIASASNSVIGGATPGDRNVISDNQLGVYMASGSGNVVAGNYIGLDASGSVAAPNHTGVWIEAPAIGNVIGGSAPGEGNVISASVDDGVLSFADGTHVIGNFVGTDASGLQGMGNGFILLRLGSGVELDGVSHGLISNNVVSGNSLSGIEIRSGASYGLPSTTDVVIEGNIVGLGIDRSTAIPNEGPGIALRGGETSGNLIGGASPGEGNLIAFNWDPGVAIIGPFAPSIVPPRAAIRGNSIFENGFGSLNRLGIDLGFNGPDSNDAGDADSGANEGQNYPSILTVSFASGSTTVSGSFLGRPQTELALDFFASASPDPSGYGEGQQYLGEATIATDAAGHASFVASLGVAGPTRPFVTATATALDGPDAGATSEFSPAVLGQPVVPVPALSWAGAVALAALLALSAYRILRH